MRLLVLAFLAAAVAGEDACGGTYRGFQYAIVSPGYPREYPPGADCVYRLQGDPALDCQQEFHLQFLDFDVSVAENCKGDYLLVGERHVFCGKTVGLRKFVGKNNTLTVSFHSDARDEAKGFKILVTALPCTLKLNPLKNQSYSGLTEEGRWAPNANRIVSGAYRREIRGGNDAESNNSAARPGLVTSEGGDVSSALQPLKHQDFSNSRPQSNFVNSGLSVSSTDSAGPRISSFLFIPPTTNPTTSSFDAVTSPPSDLQLPSRGPASAFAKIQLPRIGAQSTALDKSYVTPTQKLATVPARNYGEPGIGVVDYDLQVGNDCDRNHQTIQRPGSSDRINDPFYGQGYPGIGGGIGSSPNLIYDPRYGVVTGGYPSGGSAGYYPGGYPNNPSLGYPGGNYPEYSTGGYYPGQNPNSNYPVLPTYNQGYNPVIPNYNTGYNPTYPTYNPGYGNGYSPIYNPGYGNGYNPIYNPGYGNGYSPSYNPGYGTGNNAGYYPGYRPNYNNIYNPSLGGAYYPGQSGWGNGFIGQPGGECCRVQSSRRFSITSPGFPGGTTSANYACRYTITKSSPDVCRLILNFRYFNFGAEDQYCSFGYVEIDGRRYCGCRSGHTVQVPFANFIAKTISVTHVGLPRSKFAGFLIDVIQDSCGGSGYLPPYPAYPSYPQYPSYPGNPNYPGYPNYLQRRQDALNSSQNANVIFPSPVDPTTHNRGKRDAGYSYPRPSVPFPNRDIQLLPPTVVGGTHDRLFSGSCQSRVFLDWAVASKEAILKPTRCGGYGISRSSSRISRSPTNLEATNTSSVTCEEVKIDQGVLKTPLYPNNYPENVRKCYRFNKTSNFCKLEIHVRDFDLESSQECSKDYVSFKNDNKRYCGNSLRNFKQIFDLRRANMEVYFVSDTGGTGRGFEIGFSQLPCEESANL